MRLRLWLVPIKSGDLHVVVVGVSVPPDQSASLVVGAAVATARGWIVVGYWVVNRSTPRLRSSRPPSGHQPSNPLTGVKTRQLLGSYIVNADSQYARPKNKDRDQAGADRRRRAGTDGEPRPEGA